MKKIKPHGWAILLFFLTGVVTFSAAEIQTAWAAHETQHGGALVGLEVDGTEVAHAEWTLDAAQGFLTVYLTDAKAEKPELTPQEMIDLTLYFEGDPAPVPMTLLAQPDPATGKTSGDTSLFAGQSDRLKGATAFKATIASLFVAGQEVTDVSFSYPEGSHA